MNVLIIEDESQTADRLENLLLRYDNKIHVLGKIPSVEKTLAYFGKKENTLPDLIFLDIHLEDDLCFRILEELKLSIPIIFTTAFNAYALRAFKTFCIDYLLKPIDYQELCDAIEKFKIILPVPAKEDRFEQLLAHYNKSVFKERFMVSAGSRLLSIPVAEIAYFSYERKTTLLNTNEGKYYSLDYSMERLLELLDPGQFFRVNRSFIVSLTSISTMNQYPPGKLLIELNPPARYEVAVSMDRITAFKEWLGK